MLELLLFLGICLIVGLYDYARDVYKVDIKSDFKKGIRKGIHKSIRKGFIFLICVIIGLLLTINSISAFEYTWQMDDTPEGQETATVVEPIEVIILGEKVSLATDSASLELRRNYSVCLTDDWSNELAYRLLETFSSIPQTRNHLGRSEKDLPESLWSLHPGDIPNDIEIEGYNDAKVVKLSIHAFTYAEPLLAEIEGVRGRYFSKRLHRAVVRFVTDYGSNRRAMNKILRDRYDISVDIPDYTELTRHTTVEDAHRFTQFKNEELLAITSMFEEMPTGMLKTKGLKYLVRRLDGAPHPTHPMAPAVAWTSAGYIEFMESAFRGTDLNYVHRLILHEKAHFLWSHVFDEQLKQDWITLGGWYENPDDKDGWSTTKQTEFVSAYAHGKNPNEDMAESISFYIVNPDKLRSTSPAKYEFIQNRIMHGTRYISRIRQDLTFKVYNLYPDYVYPGKIKHIAIKVEGEPEEDKVVTIELLVHRESDLDGVGNSHLRLFSETGTYLDVWLRVGERVRDGQMLSRQFTMSKYAAAGYWAPDTIGIRDAQGNERLLSQSDFGWKLYLDNPLADNEPPQYVPNSMRLSLSKAITEEGIPYQIVTARWLVKEASGIRDVRAVMNDTFSETYSRWNDTRYNAKTDVAIVNIIFPEYAPSGTWSLNLIRMSDLARNGMSFQFTDSPNDEAPQTIEIKTTNPDMEKPVLDLENIRIWAEPTKPEAPDGETIVDITFKVKDNISGYSSSWMSLRDPQGKTRGFYHYSEDRGGLYFKGDPTVFKEYHRRIILPVGSPPGTWGLATLNVQDKAGNVFKADFTEIVRFEVTDTLTIANKEDVNKDGKIDIRDLVVVASQFSEESENNPADVNGDGIINIQDLVLIANAM